ncbi:MAG: hydroxyacid dehydrogenase [Chloroflexota bacterium]|nr:hydroxyacid dehydrogenase [Chloroflexota bacterium]MDQ6908517.1 hydroxyacid dehydrogenase [Chloroflexota bacterium]
MTRRPHIYIHRAAEWYGLYMDAENEAQLRQFADVTTGGTRAEPYTPDELIRALDGVDGILSLNGIGATEITTDVLAAVGTVRAIAISHWWHTGHVPARAMWEAASVTVIDASDATTEAVVEWVIGAALIGVRRLVEFDRRLKSGDLWAEPGRRDAGLLCESVVGLIGAGRVGQVAAARFNAFGATLIAYDPFLSDDDARALGIRRVALDELLATADVISLHMAVSDATRGMLGAREFALLKDGAVFINSARSALLDTPALVAELRKNRFHAFLDVFDTEPLPLDDPLRSLPNAFLTPHIAGDTVGMFHRCARIAIERLRDYFGSDER